MLHTTKRGFTLIETLLAISVLIMALTGPLSIVARSLQSALIAKDQTTAEYLAQDAIEYMRYTRDTACLNSSVCPPVVAFAPFTFACMGTPGGAGGCRVDSLRNTITNCSTSDAGRMCIPLNYDSTNSFSYKSGSPVSIYTRQVAAQWVSAGNTSELKVTVTVTWSDVGKQKHQVVVSENLYAWE